MITLFDLNPEYPDGFLYKPDFISKEEEQFYLDEIRNLELHNFNFQGYTANRKVASFGFDYSFDNRSLQKRKEIPELFHPLMKKIADKAAVPVEDFAELLVTEYPVGAVINWHRDAPPFDLIAGISLAADCKFKLRPQEKEKQIRSATISLDVQRRSLYIMQGEARSNWQHSISPVKQSRYSITLRTLRKKSE